MNINGMQLGAGLIIGAIIGVAIFSLIGTPATPDDETTITITSTISTPATTTTTVTSGGTTTTSTLTSTSTSIITTTATTTISQTSTLTETTTSTISTTLTATVTNMDIIIIESQEFIILSPSFGDNENIPRKFVCTNQGGENISPKLVWSTPPEGTESIVMIMDDPDAPGSFTHWVLFNLPADITELPEAVPSQNVLENGGIHGNNGLGQRGYFGPCPPAGPDHGYKFRIYAIDSVLSLETGASKQAVLTAISGHILDEAVLTGNWGR